MIYQNDTIAAVSTAPSGGGIGIIRISGDLAFETADRLFCRYKEAFFNYARNNTDKSWKKNDVSSMKGFEIRHGYVISDGANPEIVDECMLSKMPAPSTYTGENTVEINCHGGFAVLLRVLLLCLENGARAAEPGEFTKRAFLNGKKDLAEAEAVMDIVEARTEESRKAAVSQLSGRLSGEISEIRNSLIEAIAEMDVSIDYPEYEMDETAKDHAELSIEPAAAALSRLLSTYSRGRFIKNGINVCLSGSPNVGKSSLMNAFAGFSRSIVTDIPGTTRDVIEEAVQIDGIPLLINDTAGIRSTADAVESIGVDMAVEKLKNADLVLYIADSARISDSEEYREELLKQKELLSEKNTILVINKTDIAKKDAESEIKKLFEGFPTVSISAKTGDGIENLYKTIKEMFGLGVIDAGSENIITSARHRDLIKKSLDCLNAALESKRAGMALDLISCDVRNAADILGQITGQSVTEDVIDNIFSRFCVGK